MTTKQINLVDAFNWRFTPDFEFYINDLYNNCDTDVDKFIDEAYKHYIKHDDDWLEANFT